MGIANGRLLLKNPRKPELAVVEAAALVAIPRTRTVDVNPESRNIASGLAKTARRAA